MRKFLFPSRAIRSVAAAVTVLVFGGMLTFLITSYSRIPEGAARPYKPLLVRLTTWSNGTALSLTGRLSGRAVVLFFTTDCPHCTVALTHFDGLYRLYGQSVQMMGVSLSPVDMTMRLLQERSLTLPVVTADRDEARESLGITTVPVTFCIDEHGIMRRRRVGERSLRLDETLVRECASCCDGEAASWED